MSIVNTITVSATDLKRDTSEIINKVAYGGVSAVVEKHGEPVVKIVPATLVTKQSGIDAVFGSITKKEADQLNRDIDEMCEQIDPGMWK